MRVPDPFVAPVYVTRPMLPPLERYVGLLEQVWQRRWLTNNGSMHAAFEAALRHHLNVPHVSLTTNGTVAISLACRALDLTGEVITTPFTSPATPNALRWIGLDPVFADIDPVALTIDPAAIERAITPRTSAILGVHIYGMPCDFAAIEAIAKRHGLRVIYDGAHSFGDTLSGSPVLGFGDASTVSFHATKVFNSAEGGAVITRDAALKEKLDRLKALGIKDEVTVLYAGTNGRMNELQAALGLANLEVIAQEYEGRRAIAAVYRERLRGIDGISCFDLPADLQPGLHYFVLRVDETQAALSRDELHERLKAFNLITRRYFFPLCSEFPFYRGLPSSRPDNLRHAHRAAGEVLCLPFYGTLPVADAHRICDMIAYSLAA
jgi:dTDP-4-amino-4,6-dideoxygalactose transaminase